MDENIDPQPENAESELEGAHRARLRWDLRESSCFGSPKKLPFRVFLQSRWANIVMTMEGRSGTRRASVAYVLFLLGQALLYGSAFMPVVAYGWLDGGGIAAGVLAAWFSIAFSFFPTFLGVVLMILSPVFFWVHAVRGASWLRLVYLPFAINVWPFGIAWPPLPHGSNWEFYSGYWMWCGSVTLVTVSFFLMPPGQCDDETSATRLGLNDSRRSPGDVA